MGQRAAETVREIEQTRENLEGKLLALEERMPEPATIVKRLAGVAVGGGMGGTVFWFAVRKVRARRMKRKQEERPFNAVIKLIPDDWAKRMEDAWSGENAKQWAVGMFGVWAVLKLAEIRAMRRRALAA
jgi:hypothetical protein